MGFVKRRWRSLVISLVNNIFKGTHFFEVKRFLLNSSGMKIGKGTKVVGPFVVGNCANIEIGSDCWIGTGTRVYGDGRIIIGNNCDIAPDVAFLTGTHIVGTDVRRAGQGLNCSIVIEDGCWIGARSSIMGETHIECSSVVGACSFVNKNVPANCIVAGVPAKVIRRLRNENINSNATCSL